MIKTDWLLSCAYPGKARYWSIHQTLLTTMLIAILVLIAVVFRQSAIMPTGDTDGDGRINAIDLTMMQRHLLGTYDLSGAALCRSDMNQNGRIDEQDIQAVREAIMGERSS